MSSSSDLTGKCPNCGQICNECLDFKPVPVSDISCYHCGFYTTVQVVGNYMGLDELNEVRECNNLHPLSELPEQNFLL